MRTRMYMEQYNGRYGASIPEIVKNLGVETTLVNPDLSLQNLTRAVKTHSIQTISDGDKQYVIVEDCGEYAIAEIKVMGSAEDIAKFIKENDLGEELISEVI